MIDRQHTTVFVSALLVLALASGGILAVGSAVADQDDEPVGDAVIDYRGCGNTFLAVDSPNDIPVEVTVTYADTGATKTLTTTIVAEQDDLETTPEQVDGEYVLSLNEELADDGTSVIVLSVTIDGETFENPNDCLPETPADGDDEQDEKADDDDQEDDDDGPDGDSEESKDC